MKTAACPCGKEFEFKSFPSNEKFGKKKYCSKPCMYKYRVRPTGIKYNITKPNTGRFKPGVNLGKRHQTLKMKTLHILLIINGLPTTKERQLSVRIVAQMI